MFEFCDIAVVKRRKKGQKRKSNKLTKALAKQQAKKDIETDKGKTSNIVRTLYLRLPWLVE